MNIQELFMLGMKRELPALLTNQRIGLQVNLGCGATMIDEADNLDWPRWNAETDPLPYVDESVSVIHAYHFLEHLNKPQEVLREMQRVLVKGGIVNICVPHFSNCLAHQDLDHKHTFALDTWKNTFSNNYYFKDSHSWKFKIHFNIMIAIAERNTCILTQLVKE